MFTEYEPSAFFTAGRPHSASVIAATIRAGRDRATRAELLTRLSEGWTAGAGLLPDPVAIKQVAAGK